MPRRYMVQVEEDSNQVPAQTLPQPASAAQSVSASNLLPARRKRGVFVEQEEETTPSAQSEKTYSHQGILQKSDSSFSKTAQKVPSSSGEPAVLGRETGPPDYLEARQTQIQALFDEENKTVSAQSNSNRQQPEPSRISRNSKRSEQYVLERRQPSATGEKSTESAFLAQQLERDEPAEERQSVLAQPVEAAEAKPSKKLDKIEGFYRQQKGESSKPPRVSPFQAWKKLCTAILSSKKLLVALGLILILGGAGATAVFVVRSDLQIVQSQAQSLRSDLEEGRFTSAQERIHVLEKKEQRYGALYSILRPLVFVTQGSEKTTHVDQLFAVSEKALNLASEGLTLSNDVEVAYKQFVGSEQGNTLDTVEQLSGELEGLYAELSTFQAEVQQLQNPYKLELIDEVKSGVGSQLPQLRRYTLAAQKMSQVMPSVLAEGTEKNYLVLLQNNAELRPTGGFIGSFALVRIRDGKLQEFTVEDVYEADGQLQGYVTPPEEIVQYLGEEQWFLRDVNWSPDFPKVAQRAAWFLDKTLNKKVDGVVATNLSMVKKVINVTGPLDLVDYGEVITQDNLYERAEAHSELNFFPGSTQKKDFLSAVAQQLLDKMFYQPTNKVALARALLDSAEQAELLISLNDPGADEVFSTLGWTGALLSPGCPAPFVGKSCVVDTVMQVEANVGVNKANQYVSRDITHEVELLPDVARHTRTMKITNKAQSEAWPAGKYKAFLRLFVPQGSELRSAQLDGQPLDLTSFTSRVEDGKQVFGYFLEVPIKSSRSLQVFYETPITTEYQAYALFEQKQSGVWNDSVHHSLNVGEKNVVTVAPEPSAIQGRTLLFESDHTKHEFFAVELERGL